MPDLIDPRVADYLDALVPERPAEMRAMEAYAAEHSFPIIGPAAGHFCYQVARLTGARRIFELGSGYGYSTAWFARALRESGGGEVHHVVWDADLSQRARGHLERLGYGDLVQYHVAEAVETLDAVAGPFDLIFNDINKDAYPASLQVIREKLRPGGVLIIDNMLWSGRIFDEEDTSAGTVGIRRVTEMLFSSDEWITSLVPIRDGLALAFKR